jgi:hypothetical protein
MTLASLSPLRRLGAFVLLAGTLAACDAVGPDGLDASGDLSTQSTASSSSATAGPALRGDECYGTVGAITVEKIIVPFGATCTLNGTRVQSDVEVQGGTLTARNARVGGNVKGSEARAMTLVSTTVGGNVELKQGAGGVVRQVRINGDLQVEQNRSRYTLDRNTVGGNLQAFQNRGGLAITGNRVAENLQCKENRPAPTGGGNTAASKEDQCARL